MVFLIKDFFARKELDFFYRQFFDDLGIFFCDNEWMSLGLNDVGAFLKVIFLSRSF
jgi:hypothetical protein